MSVQDEPSGPRHIRHLGDPQPGTRRGRLIDVVRVDVRKARQFGNDVRALGRWLHRRLSKRRRA